MDKTLVIMAAGMGSRYGGNKQIDGMGPHNEVLMLYSIYDAVKAGFNKVVFIIKHAIEDAFKSTVGARAEKAGLNVRYAYQELDILPEGFTVPEGRTTIHEPSDSSRRTRSERGSVSGSVPPPRARKRVPLR